MKKLISATLGLMLALGCLSGCGGAGGTALESDPSESTGITASTAPEETPDAAPEGTALPAGDDYSVIEAPDFAYAYAKYDPDTPVLRVGDITYDWDDYFTILRQNISSLLYYGINDLHMPLGEQTVGEMMRDSTEMQLKQPAMLYAKAAEEGISLSAADEQEIDGEIQSYADMYFDGDKDALFTAMELSEEFYREQAGAAILYDHLFEKYFGAKGEKLDEADALAYVSDNDILYAKHILFKFVDDAGTKLDEETVEAKKRQAEETLEKLKNAPQEEQAALFDELMHSLSEDTGLQVYPDGYFFREGDMVQAFYEAALTLEEGQISEVVESEYGYHILFRPALTADAIYGSDSSGEPYTLRYFVAGELFGNMATEWLDQTEVSYFDDFESLDVAALFDKDTAAEDAQPAESAQPEDGAEPSDSTQPKDGAQPSED